MKLLVQANNIMVVDGVSRGIDTSDLPQGVQSMYFDTVTGTGQVEFDEEAYVATQVRDLEAEAEQEASTNKQLLNTLEPIYKTVMVRKPPEPIDSVQPFQVYYARWREAAPLPPPEPTPEELAEQARIQEINQTISGFTLGTVTPATREYLQAMSFQEYSAWFDQNIDNQARVLTLLKRLTFIIIRRVF